jgi:hypothetical protein
VASRGDTARCTGQLGSPRALTLSRQALHARTSAHIAPSGGPPHAAPALDYCPVLSHLKPIRPAHGSLAESNFCGL